MIEQGNQSLQQAVDFFDPNILNNPSSTNQSPPSTGNESSSSL
jgi:hypothetical protein